MVVDIILNFTKISKIHKMKFTIILVILTYSNLLFAQSGKWQELQTDFDNDLYGIYFTDSLTGYICGENGLILKTTDGINWLPQEAPTTNNLYDLHFIRDTLGWACGDSGTIIYTPNGGVNWYIQSENLSKPFISLDIFEYGNGYNVWTVGDSIGALKQFNQNWSVGYSNNKFNFIIFQSDSNPNAIIIDSVHLWSAYNYGTIWTYLWIFDKEQFAITRRYNYNVGNWSANFWLVGENGSANYCDQPFFGWPFYSSITPDTLDLFGVAVDEYAHNVWAVGEKGRILLSENEGISYSLVETPVSVNLNDICFSGYETGHIVGDNGTILYYDEEWIVYIPDNKNEQILNSYPNPFLNKVKIEYPEEAEKLLNITIYDIQRRQIRDINYAMTSGKAEIVWDGKDKYGNNVKKGVYFVILKAAGKTLKQTKIIKR